MKIVIDPGHANGTGATGNGLEEHAVVKVIAGHLAEMLERRGHIVDILDFPERSNRDDLNATIKAANAGGYDIGISLHCDASDNPDAHGAHVCYTSTAGRTLAQCIASLLIKILPGRSQSIVRRTDLAILNQTRPVWVLAECGFITNKCDAEIMRYEPAAIALMIAYGVDDFVKLQK